MGCSSSSAAEEEKVYAVFVHVYEMEHKNETMKELRKTFRLVTGMGLYHTGVEIRPADGRAVEYAFGPSDKPGTGVWEQVPKQIPEERGAEGCLFNQYKQAVEMGTFTSTPRQMQTRIKKLKNEWSGLDYDPLSRNCNHFSKCVCMEFVQKSIPSWINKLAGVGDTLMQSIASQMSDINIPSIRIELDAEEGKAGVYIPPAKKRRN